MFIVLDKNNWTLEYNDKVREFCQARSAQVLFCPTCSDIKYACLRTDLWVENLLIYWSEVVEKVNNNLLFLLYS